MEAKKFSTGQQLEQEFPLPVTPQLMPTPIDRTQVQQLMSEGAQVVEVLPRAEYEDEHLPVRSASRSRSSIASASKVSNAGDPSSSTATTTSET